MTQTQVKERPILFQGDMVRALLDGTKTQTRRVCKLNVRAGMPEPEWRSVLGCCPYGQPGERLWVRETFYCDDYSYPNGESVSCRWREVDGNRAAIPLEEQRQEMLEAMYYRADGEPEFEAPEGPTPWRPSIHMPRWASRLMLEITEVRIERLQDISDADSLAEGVDRTNTSITGYAIERYKKLWESINGAGSWDANPWVWVVEFKRLPS